MEVEYTGGSLINAQSVALRGGLHFLRLAGFVRYNGAIKAAANEFTRIQLPRLNLLRANPVCTLL